MAEWNARVNKNAPPSGAFFQSWQWGEVEQAMGKRVARVSSQDTIAQALFVSMPFGRGYWYVPRGPLGQQVTSIVPMLLQEKGADWIRLEPFQIEGQYAQEKRCDPLQPLATWITDLRVGYETILSGMQQKTRYNVRLAQKHGVTVEKSEDLAPFLTLMMQTAERDGFHAHSSKRYQSVLDFCNGADGGPKAFLAYASLNGTVLASAIFLDWLGVRTYLYGASASEGRQHMAPHVLHAWALEDACRNGLQSYDWWGIAPPLAEHHPLEGVTRFKKGFPGECIEASPYAIDRVESPWIYRLYRIAQKIRRGK